MATYSAFFSSGLHAPHLAYDPTSNTNSNVTVSSASSLRPSLGRSNTYSPASTRPSLAAALDDNGTEDREITPTPQRIATGSATPSVAIPRSHHFSPSFSTGTATASTSFGDGHIVFPSPSSFPSAQHAFDTQRTNKISDPTRPRMRRRRSSVSTGASAVTGIKSTTLSRPRSGSVNGTLFSNAASSLAAALPTDAAGKEVGAGPSMPGRMRSGSIGGSRGLNSGLIRPRRPIRRTVSTAVPALAAPPPNMPLPALPPVPPAPLPLQFTSPPRSSAVANTERTTPTPQMGNRARAYSIKEEVMEA